MTSFLRKISEFFSKIFSFGRQLLSNPFFDHVFAIAGLLYPPAAPIIDAVDRLFEQQSRDGFLEQLDEILKQSGLDPRQAEIVKHLVAMFFSTSASGQSPFVDSQKAALAREILKTAIASNAGEFRSYGVCDALRRLYGRKISGPQDKDQVPDHLVNFSIELAVVQRKFNRLLDRMLAYSLTAMQPLVDAGPEKVEAILEDGRRRGLWKYTTADYQRPEIRKAVAAALTKEEAVEEGCTLWGQPIASAAQIPDCLANFAVEACYAHFRLSESRST